MKIIEKDFKSGEVKIKAEHAEDLWYLSSIIEPDDYISAMTERKIKIGGEGEKSKITKRMIFMKILVEKIDDAPESLRLTGPITQAPDDIPKGDYHTITVEPNTIITIHKDKWSHYSIKKLDESTKKENKPILIVAFDREEALFAILKNQGYDILLDMKGDVSKKDTDTEKKGSFYAEIISQIQEYDRKYLLDNIIVASPAFWKEYLLKELTDEALRKKIILATCSSIDGTTINEILRRPELKTLLERDRSAKEEKLIEDLLTQIQHNNAAYGIEEVQGKIAQGNIATLLVSENIIKKAKHEKTFDLLDELMNSAERVNADVRVIESESAMHKLDGLTGVACLLRWKENY